MYKIPPNWMIARDHAMARKVSFKKCCHKIKKVCPCCGCNFFFYYKDEIIREEISFFEDPDNLYHLGAGFPLFFEFLKRCGSVLFAITATVALPCILTNKNVFKLYFIKRASFAKSILN